MSYIEIYNEQILETVMIGKSDTEFNISNGDYIKVQVLNTLNGAILGTLYSNRLLLKYPNADDYYTGDYHYHPENPSMGFCEGKLHNNKSIQNLQPITIGQSADEPLNPSSKYKKQVDIFKDDNDNIYIKPNEIIKLLKLGKDKYKIRVYFLQNIKSKLALFLNENKNNLIENGNFLAGLEATQTGDLDRSLGRNNFRMMKNPGLGKFVLEQDGIGANSYNMRITGIEPDTTYMFNFWVGKSDNFIPNPPGALFEITTNLDTPNSPHIPTFEAWSILDQVIIENVQWYRVWIKIMTHGADVSSGHLNLILGGGMNQEPFGRRYYTDLRFVNVNNDGNMGYEYLSTLRAPGFQPSTQEGIQ